MDVFVIPVGADRYELYCEQPVAGDEPIEPETTGWIGRLRRRFSGLIRAAEERQRHGARPDEAPKSWAGGIQDRAMAWVAERIAEQRLLWNLRGETTATAAHPADMTFDQVQALIRSTLQRDYDRHYRWMFIDGLLFLVTFVALGPLFILIPGIANLPALYFGFRAVGHFLSMRGSAHGLRRVTWSGRSCPPLGELRELATLDPHVREARLLDVAKRLRLESLPKFFERVAIPHS
jgi:K+-H+ exchange-related protein